MSHSIFRRLPIGAELQPEGGVHFRVWAPRRHAVEVVLDAPTHDVHTSLRLTAEPGGYFAGLASSAGVGTRYSFRVDDDPGLYPDPASRYQPEGSRGPSQVVDPGAYRWRDSNWRGVSLKGQVMYELHIGTFTPEGTWAAATEQLQYLADLGVTLLEVMPVAEFAGRFGWGYDGVQMFAPTRLYGSPDDCRAFVDEAHTQGLGVLLDVVYNHLGPEGNYAGRFGPYFTSRYHTPWGQAINFDGRDSEPVRRFFIDAARQWIADFHIDGLRLDAVQTMYDLGARPILAELAESVHQAAAAYGRSAVVIAETNQNDVRMVKSPEQGGLGLDGVWSDDFHHAVHSWLTGEVEGYYSDFGGAEPIVKVLNDAFVYDGAYSRYRGHRHGNRVGDCSRERFVVAIQNHDQVGNRSGSERLSALASPEAVRAAAALMLLSPFTPMLFMGEEYGETRPFPFFSSFGDADLIEAVRRGRREEFAALAFRWGHEPMDSHAEETFVAAVLRWEWPSGSMHDGLRRLYRTLLAARRVCPALVDRRHTEARLLDDGGLLLELRRGSSPSLTALLNLTSEVVPFDPGYCNGRPILLSTAEDRFGGARRSLERLVELTPFELVIAGDAACRMPLL